LTSCMFVSDLHGRMGRLDKLLGAIKEGTPKAVFIGGDILPNRGPIEPADFLENCFFKGLAGLRSGMGDRYPRVFAILGNEDGRWGEAAMEEASQRGILSYIHMRKADWGRWSVYGYSYVPPTPFLLKDWERYDVSRQVVPGSTSPERGKRTVKVPSEEVRRATIREDLETLAGEADLSNAVFLFHTPPYDTVLDRAALDGVTVDHVRVDVHVGSVALRRFIEARQPLMTLHGHIHESARLTGSWRARIGRTIAVSASHDGPELALVRFDLEDLRSISREIL
jgi:Icc-related predicted phosphoesterase